MGFNVGGSKYSPNYGDSEFTMSESKSYFSQKKRKHEEEKDEDPRDRKKKKKSKKEQVNDYLKKMDDSASELDSLA